LGHVSHGQQLQRVVAQDPSVAGQWGFPAWPRPEHAARLPLLHNNWTVQAGLQARRQVAAMARRARPQALFFHTQVPAVLAQDWLSRIPGLVSLDATPRQYDALGAGYQHAVGPAWLERTKDWLNRRCFAQARHLITWSAWAKAGLVAEYGVPPEKVTVVPPGVETRVPAARRCAPGGPVRLLFVGSDFERKGGPVLLAAFRRLRGAPAGLELHLVTQAAVPPEPGLTVHNGLGPNSPRLKALYQAADIFCLPTQADCLPVALAEAGAHGLPLVATRLAAIPELVAEDETGTLVPPGDVEQLTGALEKLIGDAGLRRRLGDGARQAVQARFDAETNTRQVLALIKGVTRGSGPN
jgi:glycosyltransferase involved in cell wall biosynthesis